jgi:hypothetical protein
MASILYHETKVVVTGIVDADLNIQNGFSVDNVGRISSKNAGFAVVY